jgi:hypothetical protein
MTSWISVKDKLPEDRRLVWIYGVWHGYGDHPDHLSIGVCLKDPEDSSVICWNDVLDLFPSSGDTEVQFWLPLEFPTKPEV